MIKRLSVFALTVALTAFVASPATVVAKDKSDDRAAMKAKMGGGDKDRTAAARAREAMAKARDRRKELGGRVREAICHCSGASPPASRSA